LVLEDTDFPRGQQHWILLLIIIIIIIIVDKLYKTTDMIKYHHTST